jgi:hypothetical protein
VSLSLAVTALACWLLTEVLGAYMLRTWVTSGAARMRKARSDGMSLPVLVSHASLNLAGLTCWIAFLLSRSAGAAWLALAFMVPAIGLGVSTVSVWTPYPVRWVPAGPESGPAGPGAISDEEVRRAMDDEAAAARLAEHLLKVNLEYEARTTDRGLRLDARALVPLAHGVLAIATFLLATLAAIRSS